MPARRNAWGVYDVFTARDGGQAFIGVTADQQWHRFCDAFGFAEWRDDPRLQGNATRCAARDWMLPALETRLSTFDLAEVLARCEVAKVPYARVGRPDELAGDPHLNAGDGLLKVAIGSLGGGMGIAAGLPSLPLEFGDGRARPGLRSQPPMIGEHSAAILAEAGFAAAEIAALGAAGIIGLPE
jgi:crotonobetainyl-CoA:carnitine CoA-transferase CaiB-like acyl-CoA transferase